MLAVAMSPQNTEMLLAMLLVSGGDIVVADDIADIINIEDYSFSGGPSSRYRALRLVVDFHWRHLKIFP